MRIKRPIIKLIGSYFFQQFVLCGCKVSVVDYICTCVDVCLLQFAVLVRDFGADFYDFFRMERREKRYRIDSDRIRHIHGEMGTECFETTVYVECQKWSRSRRERPTQHQL